VKVQLTSQKNISLVTRYIHLLNSKH